MATETNTTNLATQTVILAVPAAGQTVTVQILPNQVIEVPFDLAEANVTLAGDDLRIEFPGQAVLILSDFAAMAEQGTSPLMLFADGSVVAGDILLTALTAELPEVAAGAGGASGGAGEYRDDMGNLIDGVDRLGVQDPDPFARDVELVLDDEQLLIAPSIDIVDPDNPDAGLANIRLPEGTVALWGIKISDAPGGSTITLALSDGSAKLGEDYTLENFQFKFAGQDEWTSVTGPIVIPPGDSLLLVKTDTVADDEYEGDETFILTATLTAPGGANYSASGTATIYDELVTPPTISSSNAAVDEEDVIDGGNPDDTYDDGSDMGEWVNTGTLNVDYGTSGPGSLVIEATNYAATWDSATNTLSADDGRWELVFNPETSQYTFNLLAPLDHDGTDTEDDLVLEFTATATAANNATAATNFTVTVNDDAPLASVDSEVELPILTLDESALPEAEEDPVENDGIDDGIRSVTVDLSGNFGADIAYGADGPGSVSYALSLVGDAMGSGLYALDADDTSDEDGDGIGQGDQIMLSMDGADIVGKVGDTEYFRISVDTDPESDSFGSVTFSQTNSIWHGDPTDPDDIAWVEAAAGTIVLTQTVTDADGDSDTAEIDLSSGVFAIEDDGPTASISLVADTAIVLDETVGAKDGDANAADDDDVSANPFEAAWGDPIGLMAEVALVDVTTATGADSAGATTAVTLSIVGGDGAGSGLYTTGGENQIFLYYDGDVVVGRVGDGDTADPDGAVAFALAIDSNGQVTVAQYLSLDHPTAPDSHDEYVTLAGKLDAVVTVIDGDGDEASDSVAIGGLIRFEDDGPTASISAIPDAVVVLDETVGAKDGDANAGDDDITDANPDPFDGSYGIPLGAVAGVALVDVTAATGADSAGATTAVTLSIVGGDGAGSGLYTTGGENQIFLYYDGDVVVGRVGDGDTADPDGAVAFALAIDSDGQVTVAQYLPLHHLNPDNHDDAVYLTGSLNVVVTVTDGDGDQATDTLPIGNLIAFEDDGPVINSVMDAVLASAPNITFNGLYDADFGADGLDYMSVALNSGGTLAGMPVTYEQGAPTEGITPVDVKDAEGNVLFTFYYTTTTSAVADGGDGSVVFNAFLDSGDPEGSTFFNLAVNGDGTYNFDLVANEILKSTTVTGEDFSAFGPTGQVATEDQSLIISGSDNVNASANGIGIKNPQITSGESITMVFADQQAYVSFSLQQWTGSGSASVQLMIDGVVFDFYPDLAAENLSLSKPASGTLTVAVVVDAGLAGTWTVTGDAYTIYVASEFETVQLDHEGGSAGFNLNNITYNLTTTIEDLTLNFELTATDGDGDSYTLDDELTIAMVSGEEELIAADIDGIDADTGVVLVGDSHDNILVGGDGDDFLFGGAGNDTMTGGAGADTFIFSANGGEGNDVILDFNLAEDTLRFTDVLSGNEELFAESVGVTVTGADVELSFNGTSITLEGVNDGGNFDSFDGGTLHDVLVNATPTINVDIGTI
jgi:hypothetical protein